MNLRTRAAARIAAGVIAAAVILTPTVASAAPAPNAAPISVAAITYTDVPSTVTNAQTQAGLRAAGFTDTAVVQRLTEITRTAAQRESGGNPNAVNRFDSRAAKGEESTGYLQLLPVTFAKYHAVGTSTDIKDPVANVAAAWNYLIATYGVEPGTGKGAEVLVERFDGGY